jgi:hypothetical protein
MGGGVFFAPPQDSQPLTSYLPSPWLLLAGAPSGPRAIKRKTQAKAWYLFSAGFTARRAKIT